MSDDNIDKKLAEIQDDISRVIGSQIAMAAILANLPELRSIDEQRLDHTLDALLGMLDRPSLVRETSKKYINDVLKSRPKP